MRSGGRRSRYWLRKQIIEPETYLHHHNLLKFARVGSKWSNGQLTAEESVIAVIFEVWPADGRRESYLDHAARLRPELEKIDGFISVERFQSLTDARKMLSLSFWRDEAAVARWRNHARHRATQKAGRSGVFQDLRVAGVIRDYGMTERRKAAPDDSR
jgi:heme-degrading monooxygenase HmoA